MSAFDYVKYEMTCSCGKLVDDFNTKDGNPRQNWVHPTDVGDFYGDCYHCGRYHVLWRTDQTRLMDTEDAIVYRHETANNPYESGAVGYAVIDKPKPHLAKE